MQLKYFALQRLLANFFAGLTIHNAESTEISLQQCSKVACLQPLVLSTTPGVFPVEGCRQVGSATNIALGKYWFLLLPWLEEVTLYIMRLYQVVSLS